MSDRHILFCREYVKDFNGSQACIRAGYSAKTANVQSVRLLANAKIKAWIVDYKKNNADKFPDDVKKVVDELKKLGYSNIQDYIGENFTVNDFKKLPREVAAAIASIETETVEYMGRTTTKVKFKLFDKTKSLELLGRHLGIFEKDNAQKPVLTVIEATEFKITRRKK